MGGKAREIAQHFDTQGTPIMVRFIHTAYHNGIFRLHCTYVALSLSLACLIVVLRSNIICTVIHS